jgi:hypothetical protein
MGRRDEPKLDELQRLLRRLEYMEADKGGSPAQKVAADTTAKGQGSKGADSKGSGYVGALRGAPAIASDEAGDLLALEPEFSPSPAGRQSSSGTSTASIVIGATTAAVVSSLVVVGLLLYTQGKEGGQATDGQRLNFVAPAQNEGSSLGRSQPAGSAVPFGRPDSDRQPPADAQTLLQRADLDIRNGRLADARDSLEQAAKLGSGVAALTLGAMYDPNRVAEFGNLGVQADPTLARAWYERAQALGVVEAGSRLSELARK